MNISAARFGQNAVQHEEDLNHKYRILPHNQEAEQGLLGCLFIENKGLDKIGDFLKSEHFFVPVHCKIYEAIVHTIDRGQIASPVTLKNYFENNQDLEGVGGSQYLAELAASVMSTVNLEDYARTVFESYQFRSLIVTCENTTAKAYDTNWEQNSKELIEEHEATLFSIAESGLSGKDVVSFRDSISSALAMAETAFQRQGQVTGVTTGLMDLDNILGGLHPTDLAILAGRPSMGKTALATNIGFNAALKYLETEGREGAKVGLFSLEMGHTQITSRILGDLAGVSADAIRKGKIGADEIRRLNEVSKQFRDLPLYTDDTAGLSISALRTRARRLKRQHGIGLLIVDYLQLLQGSRHNFENRTQEISEITRGLKAIAKDLDIPVLALSQLSRDVEKRDDKRPQLSDLRDSGSIEQDADVVMFVYREEYYLSREEPSQKAIESTETFGQRRDQWEEAMKTVRNTTDVMISKQRHGPIGTVKLYFEPDHTRFRDHSDT